LFSCCIIDAYQYYHLNNVHGRYVCTLYIEACVGHLHFLKSMRSVTSIGFLHTS